MKKRVLLVDDSPSALLSLRRMLEGSEAFEVVAEARTGDEAVALAESVRPDLVTMDVYLDGQDGVDAARSILKRVATRVVLVTGLDPKRADLAFRALGAGALDVLEKPPAGDGGEAEHRRRRFVSALVALSNIGLVASRMKRELPPAPELPTSKPGALVALGASTGGPAALFRLLEQLPRPFPAPVVIVQHIEQGYAEGFAQWLSTTGHEVMTVTSPVAMRPGTVYVASGQAHLRVDARGLLAPKAGPTRNFQLSSVDELFESIAQVRAPGTFAALLSGMGDDGARGLLALSRAGATTVVQSLESCVVGGMPGSALELGAARLELSPEEIAAAARRFVLGAQRHKEPGVIQ